MKKFFTALLALILALVMAFSLAACQPSDQNPGDGGNNTEQGGGNEGGGNEGGDNNEGGDGNEDGGNEGEVLEPVDAKTFVKALLNNVTDELAVEWIATVDGETSVTAKDAEAVVDQIDLNESGKQSLAEYVQYFKNAINVLDEFDSLLTGTVPVAEDKSGYELSLEVKTEDVVPVVEMVKGALPLMSEFKLGDALGMILKGVSAEDWVAQLFSADITLREFINQINGVLEPLGVTVQKIVSIVTTILQGQAIDLDALLDTPATAEDGTAGTLGDLMKASVLFDLMLPGYGIDITFAEIGAAASELLDDTIADLYTTYLMPMLSGLLPFEPTLDVLATISVTKADLEITIKADKDMKLTDIEVSCAFNGSITMGDGTVYAANITEATFGCAVEYGAA
ncbi:MAG TPA: hypothetical protein H9729_01550 [Candidatus Borkfalkia excrementigallinarum]|uniref:Uncharacterized protein n=1 Tax=Candidatus Borkfalkia excrementigallinarum TaxID=2838506 RepID=A0A9D1ZVC6_9FIRM|nr:hypothetical protein [Candidatus Borkfalkia excrementigallinarum]